MSDQFGNELAENDYVIFAAAGGGYIGKGFIERIYPGGEKCTIRDTYGHCNTRVPGRRILLANAV